MILYNFKGFMSVPVSEDNERLVATAIIDACQNALVEMDESAKETDNDSLTEQQQLCAMVRNSERQALERTMIYMKQESEALDLKEYYQERRLKSLGLDSEWSPESDVGRLPGGADYDW
jgi:[ribulose-bisphosphate carboxylase]-lysine N-methyltransferase